MNTQKIEASDELLNLMKDFYNLTLIKICIYDLNGNEVCYYPQKFSSFCGKYREKPEINALCEKCDQKAIAECKKTLKPISYTCHAGLTECIAPIIIDGILSGFIMIGQIKQENYTDKLAVNLPEKLKKSFDELPVIGLEKINSSVNILVALTKIEYMKNYVKQMQNSLKTKLLNFIDGNLCENLSVDILCDKLNFSKREIYFLCRKNFDLTPAELVKNRRLYKATALLKTTKKSINKIAFECGIGDYNYFSKLFKKAYGISPREYRNANQPE